MFFFNNKMNRRNSRLLSVAWALFFIGVSHSQRASPAEVKDVLELETVSLECRFDPALDRRQGQLFWIRTKNEQHDNVAIGNTPFSPGYTVEYDPSAGRYDLIISNTTFERDNAQFECRKVESGSGQRLHSTTIDLVVLLAPNPPSLTPDRPTFNEGQPVNLTCASVGGSPPPDMKWFRRRQKTDAAAEEEEEELPESLYLAARSRTEPSRSVLSFVPRKEDDGTQYRCSVWNRAIVPEDTMETNTTISVNYFPRVEVGPENPILVEIDDTAELSCTVDSKPQVTEVKWMRDGRFINTNFRHLIPRANLKDAGPYICSADNGLGQTGKAELQLEVLYAPIVTLPSQREFNAGEDIVVDCDIKSNPRPHSVVWTKEGEPEFSQTGPTLRLSGSGSAAANNGRYTCTAKNFIQPTGRQRAERSGNATMVIAVRHAPGAAKILPESPTALEGRSVTLECASTPPGYPPPIFKWWKAEGGNDGGAAYQGSSSSTGVAILATGSSFTIDRASLSSGGTYFCQASNDLGEGDLGQTVLEVFQEPKLTSPLQETITKRSGDTGFHVICSAVGKPKPSVTWLKDGLPIETDPAVSNDDIRHMDDDLGEKDMDNWNLYQVTVTEQEARQLQGAYNVLSTLKFSGRSRLSTDSLTATDRGNYTCRFNNEVGEAESTMALKIEHSPIVRHQHNKVAADPGETARILCRMQAYPDLTFEWSKGPIVLSGTHSLRGGGGNSFYRMESTPLAENIFEGVLEIGSVDDSAYGEYSCKASNQLGSRKTIITLQPRSKPERPRDLRVVDTGANWIRLAWTEGFNGGYNETTYNVEYKEIGGGFGTADFDDCRWRNPCNVTGLSQHTRYQFKVKGVNLRGHSDWSREISAYTDVDVAGIPRPDNVFYELSSRSVIFSLSEAYPLGLVARIQLLNPDGESWRPYAQLGMDKLTNGHMTVNETEPVTGLRVCMCINSGELAAATANEAKAAQHQSHHNNGALVNPAGGTQTGAALELCGEYTEAEIVEYVEYSSSLTGGPGGSLHVGIIIAIVVACLLAACVALLTIWCCCCRNNAANNNKASARGGKAGSKATKLSKSSITGPSSAMNGITSQQQQLANNGTKTLYGINGQPVIMDGFVNGLDNKGVNVQDHHAQPGLGGDVSPDLIKAKMYAGNEFSFSPSMPAAQVPTTNNVNAAAPGTTNANGYDQSSSNSNNGGSVNSQDSLWNVKPQNGDPLSMPNPYGGVVPDPYFNQGYSMSGQQLNEYNNGGQYQYQHQQMTGDGYNYEEYAHYPQPEEYLNRGSYFNGGGGQEAANSYVGSSMQQQYNNAHHASNGDCSAYGEISRGQGGGEGGPYTGHDISDELRHQDVMSHTALSLNSQDSDIGGSGGATNMQQQQAQQQQQQFSMEGYSTPSRRVIREIIV